MTALSVATIVAFLLIPKFYPAWTQTFRIVIGILLLGTAISIHPYLIYHSTWNLRTSLPLQLCSLSGLLSGIVLLFPGQAGFEFLMYWGLTGAFHSLLTPEMTQGKGLYILVDYYVSHAGIILACLFMANRMGYGLRKNSWWKIFLFSQILIPVIGMVDYALQANYMYFMEKPQADNPLIIGEWPWYILAFDVLMAVHFYLIYFIFFVVMKKKFIPTDQQIST
jgi:hypothetical integral membrane protein (TIGR02206 family)